MVRDATDRLSHEEIKEELLQNTALGMTAICHLTHGHDTVDDSLQWEPDFPLVRVCIIRNLNESLLEKATQPSVNYSSRSV